MLEKIAQIIKREMDLKDIEITRETKIIEDLGADSLDAVELIMTLEDEFGVTVSDEVAQNFKTVGDIIDFLESNQ
ncbi:MAG: acyl carrier protein [Acholeplasmataceae bacterium]|nr:acyl carrier protein [Acholeplasmataceae bacterium]HOA63779.1 acyl carrier protein [Bacilli bacterium]HQA19494.1 acyl carrier protein [Bacilli bacterium]HQD92069.1 acyl carrier protein [Bacilli bacterium]